MSFLPSHPGPTTLLDVFKAWGPAAPLIEYHEALMRGPSPLSEAERELIAAYVSGLNDCAYCHGVHEATARAFGIDEDLVGKLIADLDTAPVDGRLRALLRYVRDLTRNPRRVTGEHVRAVLEAGHDERAVVDAAAICGLFNLMNRLVSGLGVEAGPSYFALAARRLFEGGYKGLLDHLDAAGGA